MALVKNRDDVVLFFATLFLGIILLFVAIVVDFLSRLFVVFASFLLAYIILEKIGYYAYKRRGVVRGK